MATATLAEPGTTACRNCGAPLAGRYCHACGQNSANLHRSLLRLSLEAAGEVFSYDNRVWRTLPRLLFSPANLTRDYLAGRRASQTSPLRMFLVVVVMVFFAAGFAIENKPARVNYEPPPAAAAQDNTRAARQSPVARWYTPMVARAAERPEALRASLARWAQRLAILLLPLGTLLLGLLFVTRRDVLMFDHLIFAMHSLTVQGLIASVVLLVSRAWPPGDWLFWAAPVHLFFHLRGAYRIGVVGTLLRMAGLAVGTVLAVWLLAVLLLFISVYEVGAAP